MGDLHQHVYNCRGPQPGDTDCRHCRGTTRNRGSRNVELGQLFLVFVLRRLQQRPGNWVWRRVRRYPARSRRRDHLLDSKTQPTIPRTRWGRGSAPSTNPRSRGHGRGRLSPRRIGERTGVCCGYGCRQRYGDTFTTKQYGGGWEWSTARFDGEEAFV